MNEEQLKVVRYWLGNGSINIFGRPFAGKDTQAKRLAELLGGHVLGGGEILRNSKIPPHVEAALHRGELIPSNDYVNIVLPYLSSPQFAGAPLILSSVGRWSGEETNVIAATAAAGHPIKVVIYLELSDNDVRTRWLSVDHSGDRGGRYDDTQLILEKRLQEYRKKTIPVIETYEGRGLLIRVDGTASRDEVTRQIVEALAARALS